MAIKGELPEEYLRLWESYLYPGTNTLKNKFGITDYDELKEKEAEVSFEKLVELYEHPIKGSFDKKHLCDIHRYIFSDVYDWAGEYRLVYMAKNNSYFASVDMIDTYLEQDLKMMNEEINKVTYLPELASFLASYYVYLLNVHPFREGNGRSIREFLREFVLAKTPTLQTGPLELDLTKIDGEKINEVISLALAFRGPIEEEFMKALTPLEPENESEIKM